MALSACKSSPSDPTLTADIVLEKPVKGATVTSDTPTFVVRNASGFDEDEATYTFRVTTRGSNRLVAEATIPAGRRKTALVFPDRLLRGGLLAWTVTATKADGTERLSAQETFRLPAIPCQPVTDPYAKAVLDWWTPFCSLDDNKFDNPLELVGPPNAFGTSEANYGGFVSLGMGGWVDVDMEACAVDGVGNDIRVHQYVSREPVTLYASGAPEGPWVLVDFRKECGTRTPGLGARNAHCDFDLGLAGLDEARYFRVEDGESYPCPGDTDSEGPDIDAIEILNGE